MKTPRICLALPHKFFNWFASLLLLVNNPRFSSPQREQVVSFADAVVQNVTQFASQASLTDSSTSVSHGQWTFHEAAGGQPGFYLERTVSLKLNPAASAAKIHLTNRHRCPWT